MTLLTETEALAADLVTLSTYFRGREFLSVYEIGLHRLHLDTRTLVRLGALVPGRLGRWDEGFRAGPLLGAGML